LAETFARQAVVLNEQLNDGGRLSIYFDFINGLFNEAHLTEMKNRKDLDKLPDEFLEEGWRNWPLTGVPGYGQPLPTTELLGFDGPRNRHGYRGHDFEPRQPLNILALGCSWTEGYGVRPEESWPAILAETLCKKVSG
jgi:hypothetical protein